MDANSIILVRALVGDANLDGTVNNTDLVALLTHYNETGQTQATGDYNGDGSVNNTDLVALLTDYGQSLPGGYSPDAVRRSGRSRWDNRRFRRRSLRRCLSSRWEPPRSFFSAGRNLANPQTKISLDRTKTVRHPSRDRQGATIR